MKKDIEWLKEEIEEDIKSWSGGSPDYFRGASDAYENVKDWLNQLEEPEVLSQKWIDEHEIHYNHWVGAVPVTDLQNLLVPKQGEPTKEALEKYGMSESRWAEVIERYKWHLGQEGYAVIEKPIIPQFVADFVEHCKDWTLYEIFNDEYLFSEEDCVARWLYDNDSDTNRERETKLVLSLKNGYWVEKEKEYVVYISATNEYLTLENDEYFFCEKLEFIGEEPDIRQSFTEEEIRSLDNGDKIFDNFSELVE